MTPDESPAIYDEWTGIGGRYVRDPVTGIRTPAPPEDDQAPADEAGAEDKTK